MGGRFAALAKAQFMTTEMKAGKPDIHPAEI